VTVLPTATTLAAQLDELADAPGGDLASGALLIATIEYPRLDTSHYLARLDELGAEALDRVARSAGADGPVHARVDAINGLLYGERGFRGNRDHYSDVRNSCLNQVIDLKTGIPITLAVVYMEVARRAGLRTEGINFPGHFLVRAYQDADAADGLVVDPYHDGTILTEHDCRELLTRHGDEVTYTPDLLAAATRRQVLVRMLVNLKRLYVKNRSFPQARLVTHTLLELSPSSLAELRDRGLLSYHLHDYASALRDLEEYLRLITLTDRSDDAREETTQVWDHVKTLRRRVASFN
jgi:regulator of sirC expression with transglutaminase-like and TPR domain